MKTKMKLEEYRPGAIGSLLDEYERATLQLKIVLQDISEEDYTTIADAETQNEDCHSIETIMNHVVRAGRWYIKYIRESLLLESSEVRFNKFPKDAIFGEIDKVVADTVAIFDGNWDEINEKMTSVFIDTSWGVRYDVEQMMEHAIVHVLRHRRQIEKFVLILNK